MELPDLDGSLQPLDLAPPLRQRVHEALESLITAGVLRPGARLVEGDLAQRLGVSRGPVRETLQLLASDGFVDLRPRQGAFVHVPTPKEIDDFFVIRGTLECESAKLAAQRITPEGAERLTNLLKRGRAMLADGAEVASVHRKLDVHHEISAVADTPLLAQMLSTLNKRSAWYMSPFEANQRHNEAWPEHEAVVEAIIRKDASGARRAMASHNQGARSHYVKMKAANSN
jgi:DNA-binding GntR family transcriptional regulator